MMFGMKPEQASRPCWMLSAICTVASTDGSLLRQRCSNTRQIGDETEPDSVRPVGTECDYPDELGSSRYTLSRFRSGPARADDRAAGVAPAAVGRRGEPRAHRRGRGRAAHEAAARDDDRRGAGAPHVSRGTLYRHFPTRADLLAAVNEQARDAAVATSEDRLRPAGELARATPTPLSVADVLNKVPPHLLGDQIVAEAMRIAGVTSAAVYLVDLEGTHLLSASPAPPSFPEHAARDARGRHGDPAGGAARAARGRSRTTCPGRSPRPCSSRGRALGTLVAVGNAPTASTTSRTRRRRRCHSPRTTPTTSTPPAACGRRARRRRSSRTCCRPASCARTARSSPATCCPATRSAATGSTTPRTPQGTWIGIADAEGNGPRAASLAAVALGAFRSARHQGLELPETIELMDATVREISDTATITTTVGFWVPPTSTFSWISCGELGPIVVDAQGEADLLSGAAGARRSGAAEGLGELEVRTRRLDRRRPPRARLRRDPRPHLGRGARAEHRGRRRRDPRRPVRLRGRGGQRRGGRRARR